MLSFLNFTFCLAVAAPVWASAVQVANFSFESLPASGLSSGCPAGGAGCAYSVGPIPGWTNNGVSGEWQPGNNTSYFNYIPNGATIAYSNDAGDTISQNVGPVAANTTYTLQVDMGLRKDGSDALGTVALLIGGVPVRATGAAPAIGNWSTFTATYNSLPGDAGKTLAIQLTGSGVQSDFDNVRLTATPMLPSINSGGVVPVYSTANTIQPGEWVSIFGANLATSAAVWNGDFPTSLVGTSVMIDGEPAYLSFVSSSQINLQAPDDTQNGPVSVVVTTPAGTASSTVTLAPFAPSFLLFDSTHVAGIIPRPDGSGLYGAGAASYDILGPTGNSLGYTTIAAQPGDTVELFAVGLGPTKPAIPAGQAFLGAAPTTNPVSVAIGSTGVPTSFAGLAAAGLDQINITIPAGLGVGDIPLTAVVGGVQTPPGVVIALQAFAGSPPQIQSLTLSASSVAGGAAVTGSVMLSAPAPSHGAVVTLTSSSNAAFVPATVTVPVGAISATFTVSAGMVSSSQTTTITALYSGTSAQAQLTVTPAPAVTLDTPAPGATQLSGHAYNVDFNKFKVVVYVLTNEFYVQPLTVAPYTNISANGVWTTPTNPWASIVVLLVDPSSYTPAATEITNPALDPGVIAWTAYPPGQVSVSFSGRTWGIKTTGNKPTDQFDPGPNFWSADPSVVSVQADGLHLKINQINGQWQSGEVYLTQSLGYGVYRVQVGSRLDQLDRNTVAAPLFIYAGVNQELDNEYSGMGGLIPNPWNAQFVSQPYTTASNIVRYGQPSTTQFTSQIEWRADHVTFTTWNGWSSTPAATDIIYQWNYTGHDIPPVGPDRVHINLWLYQGAAPASGAGDEMVIHSFTFQP